MQQEGFLINDLKKYLTVPFFRFAKKPLGVSTASLRRRSEYYVQSTRKMSCIPVIIEASIQINLTE